MAQDPNQFGQSVEKGLVDLKMGGNVISVEVGTGPLVAGQCVTIVDSAGGVPKVIALAADTGDSFGVMPYDLRRATFETGERVDIPFFKGSVVYMEASAAIARGAKVMAVVSGSKVATATTGKMIIGRALDKAAANADLIRVLLDLPGTLAP